ncbi:helix-turn-helix transcriptional regulator [Persicitalea jodogahamensis]|uniref:WYL domain-containing protein n=1 Tax=Persicitalea jodogahamensis TaxID=402147 RepID=A0A8J3G8D1_9BACT|nr:WYL domain-containing protein [Persicitalea jodogahamensis]GHB54405.1 WYL domain-containing protein [Persicitalea jodogahamensis]
MNPSALLHRRLCLIRNTEAPYRYPSKEELLASFSEMDFPSIARRSLERDIRELRDEYGIHIKYDYRRRGYYLDIPPDEDVDDFRQFVTLLERHERLSFLQKAITNVQEVGKYLQLERNEQFAGAENLPLLWDALRGQRVIHFEYAAYTDSASPAARRTVEPGILFEYRNRWYLDGWDVEKDSLRTFGLDRMTDLRLTDKPVTTDRTATYKNLRRHVIGVTAPDGAEPERVVLRFNALQSSYVRSLPLHSSMVELGAGEFELFVILNPELEKEILSFGEAVEVLEPATLRKHIAERAKDHAKTYLL